MNLQHIITGNQHATDQERIDEAMAESFPASDPPSWTSGVTHQETEKAIPSGVKIDQSVKPRAGSGKNKTKAE